MRALYRLTLRHSVPCGLRSPAYHETHFSCIFGYYDIKSDGWLAIASGGVGSYQQFHTNVGWNLAHPSISPSPGTLFLPVSFVGCQAKPFCRFKASTRSCWHALHIRRQSVLFITDPGTYMYMCIFLERQLCFFKFVQVPSKLTRRPGLSHQYQPSPLSL